SVLSGTTKGSPRQQFPQGLVHVRRSQLRRCRVWLRRERLCPSRFCPVGDLLVCLLRFRRAFLLTCWAWFGVAPSPAPEVLPVAPGAVKEVFRREAPRAILVALSSDNKTLALSESAYFPEGGGPGALVLLDLTTGKDPRIFPGLGAYAGIFSPDG